MPVSTIAFGTDDGAVDIGGETQRVPVDRPSLQKLAEITRGHFYEAASLAELKQVYQDMGSSIGYKTQPREITQWYVGVGAAVRARRRRAEPAVDVPPAVIS